MLLEVIAAISVVAVGLTAFAWGSPVAALAVSEGAQLSTATFLAVARMEEIRGAQWHAGFAGLLFPDEAALADPYAAYEARVPAPYARYARRVRMVECGVPPGCGAVTSPLLRQITVTVAYRPVTALGVAADAKTVSLTTLATQR